MKLREIMSRDVISISLNETADVAARMLKRYNIGILPVCDAGGKLCGVVTDRDLVTRCLAPGRAAGTTKVKDVMTGRVVSVGPNMDVSAAAHLMGREQVRRLPVLENGRLCGMVSLADLAATEEGSIDAAEALSDITANVLKK